MPSYYDKLMNDLNKTNIHIDEIKQMSDKINSINTIKILGAITFIAFSQSKYFDHHHFEELKYEESKDFNEFRLNIIFRLRSIRNEITYKLTFARKYKRLSNFLHIIDLI